MNSWNGTARSQGSLSAELLSSVIGFISNLVTSLQGAFAETVLCTLFGYMPKLGDAPELLNADTLRGFVGELRHVRRGVQIYIIRSGDTGVELRKETVEC